jgi:hypothetical protein
MLTLLIVTAIVAAVRGLWSPCGLSMLSSLNPVSEAARGNRFPLTAGWYVAGSVLGGAFLGAGCAVGALAFGHLDVSAGFTWALVLAAASVALLSDARVGFALPVHPRQVDERWLHTYRRWIYAGGYGVQIGAGFATYVMTAATYLTAALAVLTGRPAQAFAAGVTFGLVRGLGILIAGAARTPDGLRALLARVDRWAGPSLRLAYAIEITVAGAAVWSLAGPVIGGAVVAGAGGMVVLGARRSVLVRRS